jgi:hypothetical protein
VRRWLLSHIDIPSRCVRWCTCLAVRETCIYKNTPDMATLLYIVCGSVTASQTSMSYTIDSRCSCSSHSKRHACRSLATTPYTPVSPTTHVRLGRPSAQPTASTGYLQFDGSNSHTCCIHRPLHMYHGSTLPRNSRTTRSLLSQPPSQLIKHHIIAASRVVAWYTTDRQPRVHSSVARGKAGNISLLPRL